MKKLLLILLFLLNLTFGFKYQIYNFIQPGFDKVYITEIKQKENNRNFVFVTKNKKGDYYLNYIDFKLDKKIENFYKKVYKLKNKNFYKDNLIYTNIWYVYIENYNWKIYIYTKNKNYELDQDEIWKIFWKNKNEGIYFTYKWNYYKFDGTYALNLLSGISQKIKQSISRPFFIFYNDKIYFFNLPLLKTIDIWYYKVEKIENNSFITSSLDGSVLKHSFVVIFDLKNQKVLLDNLKDKDWYILYFNAKQSNLSDNNTFFIINWKLYGYIYDWSVQDLNLYIYNINIKNLIAKKIFNTQIKWYNNLSEKFFLFRTQDFYLANIRKSFFYKKPFVFTSYKKFDLYTLIILNINTDKVFEFKDISRFNLIFNKKINNINTIYFRIVKKINNVSRNVLLKVDQKEIKVENIFDNTTNFLVIKKVFNDVLYKIRWRNFIYYSYIWNLVNETGKELTNDFLTIRYLLDHKKLKYLKIFDIDLTNKIKFKEILNIKLLNNNYIIFIVQEGKDKSYYLYNYKKFYKINLKDIFKVYWLNNKFIYIKTKTKDYLYNFQNNDLIELPFVLKSDVYNFDQKRKNNNDYIFYIKNNIIYFINNTNLYTYNLKTKHFDKKFIILKLLKNINSHLVVWYLTLENESILLIDFKPYIKGDIFNITIDKNLIYVNTTKNIYILVLKKIFNNQLIYSVDWKIYNRLSKKNKILLYVYEYYKDSLFNAVDINDLIYTKQTLLYFYKIFKSWN